MADATPVPGPLAPGAHASDRARTADGLARRDRLARAARGWAFGLRAVAVALRSPPVLVHANDWNTAWAGLAIKALCGSRVLYDSHELWADRNGRWESRAWLVACEAVFVRAADVVVTSSPGYADVLARRYRVSRPAVVRNIPERDPSADSSPAPGPPVLVYVGGLMPGRGLEQAIDALAVVPDLRLRVVGPGAPAYRLGLRLRARERGVSDRVELLPPVAPAEVPRVLAGAFAGLCLIQDVCLSYTLSLPNKLFEYASAGVPVLASDLPVLGRLVRSAGIGEVAGPRGLAAAVHGLAAGNERYRRAATSFARRNLWAAEAGVLDAALRKAAAKI